MYTQAILQKPSISSSTSFVWRSTRNRRPLGQMSPQNRRPVEGQDAPLASFSTDDAHVPPHRIRPNQVVTRGEQKDLFSYTY